MPRDTKRVKKSGRKQFTGADYEFVDVRLTEKDKTAFNDWSKNNAEDATTLLSALVNSGYKVSISWSDYNDCFTCSFTGTEENSENYHLVMTSRSDDMFEAILIGLFKHYIVYKDGPWPTDKQINDWG